MLEERAHALQGGEVQAWFTTVAWMPRGRAWTLDGPDYAAAELRGSGANGWKLADEFDQVSSAVAERLQGRFPVLWTARRGT